MSSKAIAGIGTKFYRWSGAAWAALAEVTAINGPGMSRNTIDVTSLDSEDGYAEFITGMRDSGTIALTMNFTNTTYAAMKDDFESNVPGVYRIVLPDDETTTLEFEALVTEVPLGITTGDKVTSNVTMKISGKVVLGSAGGSGSPAS